MSDIIIRRSRDPRAKGQTVIRHTIEMPRSDEIVVRTVKPTKLLPYNFGRLNTRRLTDLELARTL